MEEKSLNGWPRYWGEIEGVMRGADMGCANVDNKGAQEIRGVDPFGGAKLKVYIGHEMATMFRGISRGYDHRVGG